MNLFVSQFEPVSGPIEGNTRLDITGTDIGATFADIENVIVAGVACNLTGLGSFYLPGIGYEQLE